MCCPLRTDEDIFSQYAARTASFASILTPHLITVLNVRFFCSCGHLIGDKYVITNRKTVFIARVENYDDLYCLAPF